MQFDQFDYVVTLLQLTHLITKNIVTSNDEATGYDAQFFTRIDIETLSVS